MPSDAVCRFCLMQEESVKDPLITPCQCRGSVEYVHKNCFNRWRREAENPRHRQFCQLCLAQYHIARKWPLETYPNVNAQESVWFILSRPYIFIVLLYYAHSIFCTKYFQYIPALRDLTATREYELLINPVGLYCFSTLLCMITSLYALFFWKLISAVKHKLRYICYYLRGNIRNYYFLSPAEYVISVGILYWISSYYIFPFGAIYVLMLPQFLNVHLSIIRTMNDEGEG